MRLIFLGGARATTIFSRWNSQLKTIRTRKFAGGVSSTLYEYATVLQMLLQHGRWGTNLVLSSNAVHMMRQDQTGGAQILCSPYQQYGLGETRYGVGAWLEEVSPGGSAYQIGSGGAFGFAP